jgi:hypothetical protein
MKGRSIIAQAYTNRSRFQRDFVSQAILHLKGRSINGVGEARPCHYRASVAQPLSGPSHRHAPMFSSPFLSGQKGRKKPPGWSSLPIALERASLNTLNSLPVCCHLQHPASSNNKMFTSLPAERPLSLQRARTASPEARTRKRAPPFYGALWLRSLRRRLHFAGSDDGDQP